MVSRCLEQVSFCLFMKVTWKGCVMGMHAGLGLFLLHASQIGCWKMDQGAESVTWVLCLSSAKSLQLSWYCQEWKRHLFLSHLVAPSASFYQGENKYLFSFFYWCLLLCISLPPPPPKATLETLPHLQRSKFLLWPSPSLLLENKVVSMLPNKMEMVLLQPIL